MLPMAGCITALQGPGAAGDPHCIGRLSKKVPRGHESHESRPPRPPVVTVMVTPSLSQSSQF